MLCLPPPSAATSQTRKSRTLPSITTQTDDTLSAQHPFDDCLYAVHPCIASLRPSVISCFLDCPPSALHFFFFFFFFLSRLTALLIQSPPLSTSTSTSTSLAPSTIHHFSSFSHPSIHPRPFTMADPRMSSSFNINPHITYNTVGGANGPLVILDNVRSLSLSPLSLLFLSSFSPCPVDGLTAVVNHFGAVTDLHPPPVLPI